MFLCVIAVLTLTNSGFTGPVRPDPPPPPFGPETITTIYQDEYGNQLDDDTVSYPFEDISGSGIELTISPADNGTGDILLPYNINFYGQANLNLLHVSENGFITFSPLADPVRLTQENKPLPTDSFPNNLVAPFWMDLGIDSGDSTSKVSYTLHTGGINHVVIQWNNLIVSGTKKITFQAILYETGMIYFVYKPTSESLLFAMAGIEDADGLDGISLLVGGDLSAGKSVSIAPPPAGVHVKARPQVQSGYINSTLARFAVTITNTTTSGTPATDIYALSYEIESTYPLAYDWNVEFFNVSCTTPLSTFGPLAKDASADLCVQVTTDSNIQVGYNARIRVDLTSQANSAVSTQAYLQVAVSVAFTQLYRDGVSSLKLDLTTPKLGEITIVESDFSGDHMAFTMLWPNEYMAAWRNGNLIQYRLFRRYASGFSSLQQIAGGEQNAGHKIDYSPAFAATEDGHIGMLYLKNSYRINTLGNLDVNSNMYFSLLDRNGTLLSGYPMNLTGNSAWFDIDGGAPDNVPQYLRPTIIQDGTDRFFLAWQENYPTLDWIEYAVVTTTGDIPVYTEIQGYDDLHRHVYPIALHLRDGNILVTFVNYSSIGNVWPVSYTILDANGVPIQDVTAIPGTKGYEIDVEQLTDGTIIFAWTNLINSKIAYAALDEDYTTVVHTPTDLDYVDYIDYQEDLTPIPHTNYRRMSSPSITHDAEGHAIITWQDGDWQEQLYYAMLGSDGEVITPAMLYRRVGSTFPLSQISTNGLGNAPLAVERVFLPAVYRH